MATAELAKTKPAPFTIAPITFEVQREAIAKLADDYMPLTVASVDDKKGLAIVHEARMHVRKLRLSIEERRKTLKADSLEYGRMVDSAAKELTALITPIEAHLEQEESIVKREQDRLAREAQEKRVAMVRERLSLLQQCGKSYLASDIDELPQDEFDQLLAAEQADKKKRDEEEAAAEAERQRIEEQQRIEAKRLAEERVALEKQRHEQEAKAAEAKRIEDDRIAVENARLEKIRLDQEAEQRKLDAEKKRIADEEAERQRQAALEKAKAEAAEKARLDAIAEQERIAAAEKAHAEAAEAERKRVEALRPDREKLLSVVASIHCIVVPDVSDDSRAAVDQIRDALRYAARDVQGICDDMIAAK